MDYIYAALLLHSLGKPITEDALKQVIKATGSEVDEAKVKVIVEALKDVDIDKAIAEAQTAMVAAPQVAVAPQQQAQPKTENKEEEKKAEESAAAGLSSLFE